MQRQQYEEEEAEDEGDEDRFGETSQEAKKPVFDFGKDEGTRGKSFARSYTQNVKLNDSYEFSFL